MKKELCKHAIGVTQKGLIVYEGDGHDPGDYGTIIVTFKYCPFCGVELKEKV